jgi:hypothetical protein
MTRSLALAAVLTSVAVRPGLRAQVPAPTPFAGPPIEASGVVAVPNSGGALMVADGHDRTIYWMDVGAGRAPVRPVPMPLGLRLPDPEDITTDGTFFYAVASQSRGAGRNSAGLVRFTFDAAARRISGAQALTGLTTLLDARVSDLARLRKGKGGALDIEGLTFDRVRGRLLLGLRSPMLDRRALVISLRVNDSRQPLSSANVTVENGMVALDLGGLAVRGLGYDADSDRILIIGGASTDAAGGTYRLFEWDGHPTSTPREVAVLRGAEKPEGVTRIRSGGVNRTLIVFDRSRFQLIE